MNEQSKHAPRIPILLPDTKHILMRQDMRLPQMEPELFPEPMSTEGQAKYYLRTLGFHSIKALGTLDEIEATPGFAVYNAVGAPIPPIRGHHDPNQRLALFNIQAVLRNEKHLDTTDSAFISQALALSRKHVRHIG